jgi:Glyoxalase/Bleomycin resistance protein/Dioxygenase superfamily
MFFEESAKMFSMNLVLPASTRHTKLLQTERKLDMTTQKKSAPAAFQSNHDVAIHVPDLKIAENFYAGVLGFHLVSKSEGQLHFDTGTLHLWVNQDAMPKPFIPSFSVPDFDSAERHLKAAGCKTVTSGSATYFKDPFGFIFDVIEA